MIRKRITLDYLEKKVWWWRRQEIRRNGVPGVLWDKLTKEAARNYELMRRSPGANKVKKSYLELNSNEKAFVHILFGNWPKPVCRFATHRGQFNEKGWTPVFPNPPVQWNLKLADCILVAEFRRQITIARTIQRIRPQHPLKGKKRRSESWKSIEIIDRQKHHLGTFSDSERHMASDGRRKGRRFLRQFNIALAKAVEVMREDRGTVVNPPEPSKPATSLESLAGEEKIDETEFVQTSEFFSFQVIDSWR